jgi:GH25 family lysozyme M1 (1,4-beta-N-acetylmuramidase)
MAVGIDISPRYQEGINWGAIDDSDDPNRGARYCWVKVSDGGAPYRYNGLKPDSHYAGARSRSIPVGGYHYAQPSPSPEAQADIFVAELRRLGYQDIVPMCDLEAPFVADNVAKQFGIRFCNRVFAHGFRPGIYMSAAFARVLRPDQWAIPGLVIIIARYGNVPEAPGSSQYLGRYDVHQFASNGSRGGEIVDLDDARNNLLYIGGFTVSDSSNIQAVYDVQVVPKQSKVPGSTASYPSEEFVRFTNAHTYDMMVNKWPALFTALNSIGATLSVVFTTIDAKLDAILDAVDGGSALSEAHAEKLQTAVRSLREITEGVNTGLPAEMNLSDTDGNEIPEEATR